jgi:pimeloyl-ACP methyl ester carboxylesterase
VRLFVTQEFASRLLVTAYSDPDFMTPEIAAGYQRQLRVVGWDEALLAQLKGGMGGFDALTVDELAAIDVPILMVWGEDDTWIPMAAADQMRRLHPEALWITYPNSGHVPMEESAAAFNADLLAFLAQALGEEAVNNG